VEEVKKIELLDHSCWSFQFYNMVRENTSKQASNRTKAQSSKNLTND
jgi:hypothetical protein